MARRPPLRCWLDGVHVADLEPRSPWDLRARYTGAALDRWEVGTPLLSCSLPLMSRPAKANAFVRGVLPEGRQLDALAREAKVPTNYHYELLARFGRDIAGAVLITTGDDDPNDTAAPMTVEPYRPGALDDEVSALGENPLGLHTDSELSIAGVQNKLLLVGLDAGGWGRPVHGYPSTHILKIDDDRYPGLVRAEAQCLALAHAVGLASTAPLLEIHGGRDCLIVARYDRVLAGGHVRRRHQEDACQALGVDIDTHQGRGKYERFDGPTLGQIARLLTIYGRPSHTELEQLLALVTFTVAIANADLHGKNVSFVHDGSGHIELAPAYDTVPTMMWPTLRATSAVSVDGHDEFDRIGTAQLVNEATSWGLGPDRAQRVVAETGASLERHLESSVTDPALVDAIARRIPH